MWKRHQKFERHSLWLVIGVFERLIGAEPEHVVEGLAGEVFGGVRAGEQDAAGWSTVGGRCERRGD